MSDFCKTFDCEKALKFAKMVLIDDDDAVNGPPGFVGYQEGGIVKDNDLWNATLRGHDSMGYFSSMYAGEQGSKCKIPCFIDAIRRTDGRFRVYFEDFELLEKEQKFLEIFDSYKFQIQILRIENEKESIVARLMRIDVERDEVKQSFCFALVALPEVLCEYTNPINGKTSTYKQSTYSFLSIQEENQ